MPRGKRAEKPTQEPVQNESVIEPNFQNETDEQLVQKYVELRDWTQAEKKRFDSFLEPHKQTMDVIENEFLRRLNERGADSTKTDCGTAYKSQLLNVSVTPEETAPYQRDPGAPANFGREALLDFALDNWDAIGSELLIISAQKDAVKKWLDEHGAPPPGVRASWFTKVNIRRA